MPAKLVSDDGEHVVIRPLVYVGEDEARLYAKECELPDHRLLLSGLRRPGLQRQRVKRLLMDLESEHPGVKQSMLKALAQRRAAAPARHAPQSARRAARQDDRRPRHDPDWSSPDADRTFRRA